MSDSDGEILVKSGGRVGRSKYRSHVGTALGFPGRGKTTGGATGYPGGDMAEITKMLVPLGKEGAKQVLKWAGKYVLDVIADKVKEGHPEFKNLDIGNVAKIVTKLITSPKQFMSKIFKQQAKPVPVRDIAELAGHPFREEEMAEFVNPVGRGGMGPLAIGATFLLPTLMKALGIGKGIHKDKYMKGLNRDQRQRVQELMMDLPKKYNMPDIMQTKYGPKIENLTGKMMLMPKGIGKRSRAKGGFAIGSLLSAALPLAKVVLPKLLGALGIGALTGLSGAVAKRAADKVSGEARERREHTEELKKAREAKEAQEAQEAQERGPSGTRTVGSGSLSRTKYTPDGRHGTLSRTKYTPGGFGTLSRTKYTPDGRHGGSARRTGNTARAPYHSRLIEDEAFDDDSVEDTVDRLRRLERFIRSPGEYRQAIAIKKEQTAPTPADLPPVFSALSRFIKP